MWRLIVAIALGCGSGGVAWAEVPDVEAARSLAAKAHEALRENAPEVAADWFEKADAVAPHPLWRLAAGEAWLAAGEPEVAKRRIEAAIAGGLEGAARRDADEKLALARTLVPIVARARELTRKPDYARAMSAWEEAFAAMPLGRFIVLATRAADNGRRDRDALRLARVAQTREDLSLDERRWVASLLARVTVPPPVERRLADTPAPVVPWVIVGSGGALVLGGIVALVAGEDAWSDVRAMKAGAIDGVVFGATRAGAEARADDARTWTTIGWVGVGVGAVMAGIGTGWLVAGDASTQRAGVVGLAPTGDGLVLSASGGF